MSTSKGKVGPNSDLAEATGSVYPHLLLLLLQVLALSSPIFPSRRALFATVLASMAVLAHMNRFTNNPIHANFAALAWPHYLATIEKVLFCNPPGPETDLWRIDSTRQEALSFAGFGYRKIRWAVVLLFNLRGIRWNWEVKNVPKSQVAGKVSRGRFLLWQIVNLIGFVFMADLVAQLSIRLFFTSHDGRVGTVNSKYIDIRDPSWLRSFVNTLVFGAGPYYFINMQYIAVSIIFVALGISKPEVCFVSERKVGDSPRADRWVMKTGLASFFWQISRCDYCETFLGEFLAPDVTSSMYLNRGKGNGERRMAC